jgi:hypothetical protein
MPTHQGNHITSYTRCNNGRYTQNQHQ